jgi:hypothetical protein
MSMMTSKILAAAVVDVALAGLGLVNQAAARISDPFADQKALESAIVAPESAELSKDGVSGATVPLMRVAPHASGSGGCMHHG